MAVEKCCDTCAHKVGESRDEQGERIIDCGINEFQMYSPYASDCKRWEKDAETRDLRR